MSNNFRTGSISSIALLLLTVVSSIVDSYCWPLLRGVNWAKQLKRIPNRVPVVHVLTPVLVSTPVGEGQGKS